MPEMICANCSKPAGYVCMRCNIEPYCSKFCQTTSFERHRGECFPIPPLKKIVPENPMNGLCENAIPISGNNSCDFDDSEIANLEDRLSRSLKQTQEPKELPKTQQKKGEEPKEKIATNVSSNTQNQAQESKEKVITNEKVLEVEIPVKNDNPPVRKPLVTPAFNQGAHTVPPNTYNKTPSVASIPKQEAEKVVEEAPKAPEKKMYMDGMRRNQQANVKNQMQKKTRFMYTDLKSRPLKMGKVNVRIQNGNETSKLFYVTEAIDGVDQFISHIESNIIDFLKTDNTSSYKPIKDEMVLAKFDGVYFRAVVEDINNDDPNKPVYSVFFVDYGNDSQVTEDEMKPFSKKIANELILNSVYLRNFPENITDKHVEVLTNEQGTPINVVEESDNCYIADIVGF